ncbi:hypothetical protein MTR67_023487 [Solanum verrucosum]|uniref:Uncharacterized protein n=1 Tax=Solanum verrucosum TaxID=315347 RepID=A0AAF0QTL5_SOLVR|nr:hypothetical protein MTR67_023487 [Solanum verrucosum]
MRNQKTPSKHILNPLKPQVPIMDNLPCTIPESFIDSLCNHIPSSLPTSLVLHIDRTGSPGASSLLYPGSGREGSVDNPPESELPCSNDYGGNASLYGQLYESSVVEQPPKSPSPCDDFIFFSLHATTVEPPNPFQPTICPCKGRSLVFHSSETEFGKPSLQPLGTDIQSNGGCNTRGRTGGNNSLVQRNNKLKRSSPYAISRDGRQNDIIRTNNPCILALLETRLQDHSTLKEDLNFNGMLQVPAVGRVGGTVLLWHDNLVVVNQVRNSNHELHAMVQPDFLGFSGFACYVLDVVRLLRWKKKKKPSGVGRLVCCKGSFGVRD